MIVYDEMHDQEYLVEYPLIKNQIERINNQITPLYDQVNSNALKNQMIHRRFIAISVFFGTIALLCAILQSGFHSMTWLMMVEWIALIVAMGSVALGSILKYHMKWLIARHQAERLRQLKFNHLIDPLSEKEFKREINDILETKSNIDLERWIIKRGLVWNKHRWNTSFDNEAFISFIEYYQKIHLAVQIAYFKIRGNQNRIKDSLTKFIPPALFFGSIFTAFAHIFIEGFSFGAEVELAPGLKTGVLLILLTITLPVIGAGIRTVRGASEFGRNASRYKMIGECLESITIQLGDRENRLKSLVTMKADIPENLIAGILQDMYNIEETLEFEHQAWLNLMMDAEWFG